MQKYSDPSKCAKCGGTHVDTEYKPHSNHMARKCNRCGYVWNELPLDADDSSPAPALVVMPGASSDPSY